MDARFSFIHPLPCAMAIVKAGLNPATSRRDGCLLLPDAPLRHRHDAIGNSPQGLPGGVID